MTTEVSEETLLWAASRVVVAHADGRCNHCPQGGGRCRLLGWADSMLRRWERERGATYPSAPPYRPPENLAKKS